MDTMFWTKITGGLCGALLIFLLVNWGAEELYHVGGKGHGDHGEEHGDDHGDDHSEEKSALAWIEVEKTDGGPDVDVVEIPFEEYFAAADAAAGERGFSKCKACHKVENGANGTGPHLFGVVNRPIGTVADYSYSSAVAELGGEWTPENLNAFLTDPRGFAPGTKMQLKINKPEDRANLIAYLQTIGG